MPMLRDISMPDAREAEENLRVIRELMERSTRYSTFSGLSGVLAGTASIIGCIVTGVLTRHGAPRFALQFLTTWTCVLIAAVGADYLLRKRHAVRVGKRIVSRLGKQMAIAAAPGLGTGALLTVYLVRHASLMDVYPMWMLCYGIAVCAVGLFSQREVSYLGTAFLLAGAVTLLAIPASGLAMMALTFGGFHIGYGLIMARSDGW